MNAQPGKRLVGFNAKLDDVFPRAVVGIVATASMGDVTHLRVHLAGLSPGVGESTLRFGSGAYAFCRRGGGFAARRLKPGEDVVETSDSLPAERPPVERI